MPDIIAIGGATRDITFLTDHGKVIETPEDLTAQRLLAFEYGAKIRSEEVRMNFGGGACNAAATFAQLGLQTSVLARIGSDGDGKSILENLKKRGIGTELVQIDEQRSTAFSFIVVDSGHVGGERVTFSHRGAANALEIRSEEIGAAQWIYLTSLGGDFEDSLRQIVVVVREKGIKLAWNPGEMEISLGKEKLAEAMAATHLLIVNRDEAIELLESDPYSPLSGDDFHDVLRLIRSLKSWGAENVVITDGKQGAYLLAGDTVFKAPAFAVQQLDTTGAGDAFGSALVAGCFLTQDFETALKYAVLNSGGEVSEFGAESGILSRAQIEANLDKIAIEKLQ